MAIKLADTLAPMADFPAALAEHVEFSDGKSLQEKYDLGELGGEGGGGHIELTQAEYDALTDEEKLNGAIYFITDAIGGGEDISIDDNNVSLDSTWSSAKIVTEISDNYAIFEGVIGDSYYSTTIDEEEITNAPATLYGGWTLDRVNTNFTEGSILSAFNNATKKRVLSLTEDVRIGEVYADSFSVYDDTMNNGGNPYKVALLWDNTGEDDSSHATKTNYLHENKLGYIAHRGSSISAPTNSTKAFELAGDFGYEAIELDVQYTSDGVPVIMHDSTVDATTDGTGEVANMTLSEIKSLQLDTDFLGKDDEIIRVPTFEESIKACKKKNLIMNIDCSKMVWTAEIMHDIVGRLKKYNMLDYCFFVMTNEEQRELFLSLYPDICITWLSSDPTSEANIEYCNKYKNAFVTYSVNNITETLLEEYNKAGIPVFLYQCQTPQLCEKYAGYGVRFIETDYILPYDKIL